VGAKVVFCISVSVCATIVPLFPWSFAKYPAHEPDEKRTRTKAGQFGLKMHTPQPLAGYADR
jgi:hypothetical protein